MQAQADVIARVVEQDHRLEAQTNSSARSLMQHRWHWTLDQSNPQRMSLRAYADVVGRSKTMISTYANGFVLLGDGRMHTATPTEALIRANMSVETEAATEAVAQAHDLSFVTVHNENRPEVRRVREVARERAEERGTTVADEAPQVAQMFVRTERAEQRQQETRQERYGMTFIEVENELDKAKRHLLRAAQVSEGVFFEQDQRDLLAHTLDNVRRLLEMMDHAIVGNYSPDWQQALRVIDGGVAS